MSEAREVLLDSLNIIMDLRFEQIVQKVLKVKIMTINKTTIMTIARDEVGNDESSRKQVSSVLQYVKGGIW